MKIIIDKDTLTDNVTSFTVDSEDANFPKENIRDDFTTNVWRAEATTATLTVYASKGSAIEILNTNATSVIVTAGSGESWSFETDWSFEAGWSFVDDEVTATVVYSLPGTGGRLWADYSLFTAAHVVTVVLAAADYVYAGIMRAGNVETFPDPALGLGEGAIDYSVEKELNIGAAYYRKRNVVRQFDGVSLIDTRANCWALKHDIFDAVGPEPLAIRLISGGSITDWEFVAFAKCINAQIEHITPDYSRISFTLEEVI